MYSKREKIMFIKFKIKYRNRENYPPKRIKLAEILYRYIEYVKLIKHKGQRENFRG